MPADACRHGLVRDGGCASDMYMRMEEDYTAYFSWWNVVLACVGLVLALFVYLPLNFVGGGAYLRTKDAWWVNYLVTPLIVTSCAVSVSLALTSQALFAHNLDRMIATDAAAQSRSLGRGRENRTALDVSVQLPVLQDFMHHNVLVHLVPGAVAVVSLLVLATGSMHGADVRTVVLSTLLMCAVLWVLYFATPIVGFRDGKTYVGWSKLVHVYSNPSPLMLAGHCAFAIACALLIPYFVIGRSGSSGATIVPGPELQGGAVASLSHIVQLVGGSTAHSLTPGTLGNACGPAPLEAALPPL